MDVLGIVGVVTGVVGALAGVAALIIAIMSYQYGKKQAKEQETHNKNKEKEEAEYRQQQAAFNQKLLEAQAKYQEEQKQQHITEVERQRRSTILTNIAQRYKSTQDRASPSPPNEYVEAELEKMGETWRQDRYY